MTDLKELREYCGEWDDDLEQCDNDYSDECPFHSECQKEAESEDE